MTTSSSLTEASSMAEEEHYVDDDIMNNSSPERGTSEDMRSSPPSLPFFLPANAMRANHGTRYGLELLIGVRHPSASLSFDHGAFMIAKRRDEPFYRACFFFASSEIRFTYADARTALRQLFDLRGKRWTYMREPVDVYVTCHGTGLPSEEGPFWKRSRYP